MQEYLAQLLSQYASIAPLIVFLALVIAALNIPISEDLTVIAAGVFVANVAPQGSAWMYLALIAGAMGGDMLSYLMGRKVGRPLLEMRLFRRMISKRRLELLSRHFARHAVLTILLGRLIPFGVRNGISLFAGISRMSAWKFLLFDLISGSFSISVLYLLSQYYSHKFLQDFRTVQFILLLFFMAIVGYITFRFWRRYQRHTGSK